MSAIRATSAVSSPYFLAGAIDEVPELLADSYRLRYQVYCVERGFLPADACRDGIERDEFDAHALHIAAFDPHGEMAGTVRLVRQSELGLPMFRRCTLFPDDDRFCAANTRLVEIGRLCVSRQYRRRRTDAGDHVVPRRSGDYRGGERRRHRDEIFLTMTKALYHETKRIGASHWLVATEKSLQRMLAQHGFSFRVIGPETDYFGPVAPYQLDIAELDQAIVSGRFPSLADFLTGLEPELRPQPAAAASAATERARPVASTVGAL